MTPPPGYLHDNAVSRIIRLFSNHLSSTGNKGTVYVPRAAIWTSPNTYLEPDLFYVSAETEASLEPNHRTTADLVVEVISPGSAIYDRNTKADTYAALGVKELWLVDESQKLMEILVLEGERYGTATMLESGDEGSSSVLTGLKFRGNEIFGD